MALFVAGSVPNAVAEDVSISAGSNPEVTLTEQFANPNTPAAHKLMAQRFEDEASTFDRQAAQHEQLAARYRKQHNPSSLRADGMGLDTYIMAGHCDRIATSLKTSANEAREVARLHRNIAEKGAK